jgi:hypothetical protein
VSVFSTHTWTSTSARSDRATLESVASGRVEGVDDSRARRIETDGQRDAVADRRRRHDIGRGERGDDGNDDGGGQSGEKSHPRC